jgi:hypothetical protein
MNQRARRWLTAAVATVISLILLWAPSVAQAGITLNGLD